MLRLISQALGVVFVVATASWAFCQTNAPQSPGPRKGPTRSGDTVGRTRAPTEISGDRNLVGAQHAAPLPPGLYPEADAQAGGPALIMSRGKPRGTKTEVDSSQNKAAALSPDSAQAPREKSLAEEVADSGHVHIEVSHSRHVFRLLGAAADNREDVLYECRVGLGARGFPTPVGVYFVTHIFDDDPWWIPPKDRSWAAGQSPSRRVYGGIMAPLLKKKALAAKRTPGKKAPLALAEDFVEKPVKLDDYGYRFHGTNQPRSIGRNESHGCVRMLPDDVKKVAALIKEHVGIAERRESENGTFVVLRAPVRLDLIK
jgi:hypothetical protein